MSPRRRLILACVLFSSWMVLLMTGFVLGGALHVVLVLALTLFPWRAVGSSAEDEASAEDDSESAP